jgi:hypothetical protein
LALVPFVSFFPTLLILTVVHFSPQLCNLRSSGCVITGFRCCGYKRDICFSGMLRIVHWLLVRPINRRFETTYRALFSRVKHSKKISTLLGCDTLSMDGCIPTFLRIAVPSYSRQRNRRSLLDPVGEGITIL